MSTTHLIHLRPRAALAGVVIAATAISIAACGSDESRPSAQAPLKSSAGIGKGPGSSSPQSATPPARPRSHTPKHRHHKAQNAQRQPTTRDTRGAARDALKQLPVSRRTKVVRDAAHAALQIFDLQDATIQVASGGTRVTVVVPRAKACTPALSGNASGIVRAIRTVGPSIAHVELTVAGTGRTLAQFASACGGSSSLPSTSGQVVLTKNGSGMANIPQLKVTASHWTIAYSNSGAFFEAFPIKGKKVLPNYIRVTQSGSGKQTYSGPGTFSLRIAAAGAWTIKVTQA
jgi:hypothetical protein